MSSPDIDPYATLGVPKEASITEIRAAHRKRVLKCHPDKIQDESQRMIAQDEFQRVQQAYELLSDETRRDRYDKKVRLAELKRDVAEQRRRTGESAYAVPRSGSSREFREGHVVEERAPMESFLDEEFRFTDEPRPMHRKTNDYERRPKTKTEEKKKTRAPPTSERAAKEQVRESTKASHSERQRQRDRERQRQTSEKYYDYSRYISDESESESEVSEYEYVRMKKQPSRRTRESRSRPAESSRRREHVYEDAQYRTEYKPEYKPEYKSATRAAEDYIERTKYGGVPDDPIRSSRSPQRRRGYDSVEPEISASRRAGRSSYENLDSPSRNYESKPPKMPSVATQPINKASLRPSLLSTRSANAAGTAFTRPKASGRDNDVLAKMAAEPIPRSSKKYESAHSSPCTTPEIPQASPKVTTRYTIEPTIIEPSKSKYRTASPSRRERERDREPRTAPPKRASTYDYKSESSPRIEVRQVRPTRPHGDVEYSPRVRREDVKFAQEIRPTDATTSSRSYYGEQPHRQAPRRMATYA
ncbi:hypothetical protein N7468_001488 [Penicillium chermesinum]|uniref:J domain-containing protein n=1 Tax=Penicillium chermesinum TaxID=63820 RepID=A0A9W9TWT7_9EURO|nr:uncharacterized protein N7468_001488 [Penicillium chermesinum]KAJ5246505.1 hypothetical protein N7468_001488 [Penicillium chermesinum]